MARQMSGSLCLAVFIVMASLIVPTTVPAPSELSKVPHGFPVAFVWQSVDKLDPPSFPQSYGVMLPQEDPTWVSFPRFLLNVALVGSIGFVTLRILDRRKAAHGGT